MQYDPFNLIITGVGGQGNVLASQIIGRVFIKAGYEVTIGETYGLSQRGGAVTSHLRLSRKQVYGPIIPNGQAHAAVSLEPLETLRVWRPYGHPEGTILVNNRAIYPLRVISGEAKYLSQDEIQKALEGRSRSVIWIPATAMAMELGKAILANMVMLGALAGSDILDSNPDGYYEVFEEMFPGAVHPPTPATHCAYWALVTSVRSMR